MALVTEDTLFTVRAAYPIGGALIRVTLPDGKTNEYLLRPHETLQLPAGAQVVVVVKD